MNNRFIINYMDNKVIVQKKKIDLETFDIPNKTDYVVTI